MSQTPEGSDIILRMKDIVKSFGGIKALSGVDLEVRRGEVLGICGENGAGKSTLMKVLSGVWPHGSFEGEIEFNGSPAHYRSINDSEHDGIVIIHQELALSPYLSIAENIFLGNEHARFGIIDWDATNREAARLLARVGLKENPGVRAGDIGVGKQQLVEIAKALSKEVKLLILDEPTAALNDEDSDHLLGLIEQLREQGITSIIISHKLKEIRRIADRVTIIRDGATIETIDMSAPESTEGRIIKAMVGRELSQMFPPRTPEIGPEKFRVENWTVHSQFDRSKVAIDNVSFHVNAGEIVGFAGLMGAGRTELAMSIFGHSWGSDITGQLYKDGAPFEARTVGAAITHGLAYTTEDRKKLGLNLIGTVQTNISAASLGRISRFGVVSSDEEVGVAEGYRRSMNIKTPSVATLVGGLSGGNQQKVVLSKWLQTGPDVLILDEPTRGIDVGAKYEIYELINQLAAQGKAVIVISSELPEVLGLADRIYALSEGRITGEVAAKDATQEVLMQFMTAGRDEAA